LDAEAIDFESPSSRVHHHRCDLHGYRSRVRNTDSVLPSQTYLRIQDERNEFPPSGGLVAHNALVRVLDRRVDGAVRDA
jgi:hypothetical protein